MRWYSKRKMFSKLTEKITLRVTVSNHTVVRVLALGVAFFLGLQVVYMTRSALTLIVVAFFFALTLNPSVSFLAKRLPGKGRGLATAVSYLAVLSALGLVIYATVPPFVSQTQQFIKNLPEYVSDLKNGESFASRQVKRLELSDELENVESNVTSWLTHAGGPLLGAFQRIAANLVSMITVLVLAFFMLIEGPQWIDKVLRLQPKDKREHRRELARRMYRVVTGYVNGQLLVAFIAGATALTIMSVLKVFEINIPFIIPLAALVFVTGLIPLIGNTLGAIIVVAVALFESLPAGIIMAVFFLVYQQVENNAIQPIVQSRSVEMTPLTILVAALIGITLAGLLGALLAIPIAGCLRIVLNDYLARHKLTGAAESGGGEALT